MSTLHRQFPRYVFARRSGQPEAAGQQPAPHRREPAPRQEQRAPAQGAASDTEASAILGYN
jgi:hypothetical protein